MFENISYTMKEKQEHTSFATDILANFESAEIPKPSTVKNVNKYIDELIAQSKNYELNYTTKQLTMINDYYQLGSTRKLRKTEIIERIVSFESEDSNTDIVTRRQTLWFYMEELKNDSYTSKYIWSL